MVGLIRPSATLVDHMVSFKGRISVVIIFFCILLSYLLDELNC